MAKAWYQLPERCLSCGRFVAVGSPGTSWSQTWSYEMDGSPNLNDPRWQCAPCTDKYGIPDTNCANPDRYRGRIAIEPTA